MAWRMQSLTAKSVILVSWTYKTSHAATICEFRARHSENTTFITLRLYMFHDLLCSSGSLQVGAAPADHRH